MRNLKPFAEVEQLCHAIQPDGRHQRCIRFDQHDGPHQTFVAEWAEGDPASRRRQVRPSKVASPAIRPHLAAGHSTHTSRRHWFAENRS